MRQISSLLVAVATGASVFVASGPALAQISSSHLKCYSVSEKSGNSFCISAGNPVPCCTGHDTGTCLAPGGFKANASLLRGAFACKGGTNPGVACTCSNTCVGGVFNGQACANNFNCPGLCSLNFSEPCTMNSQCISGFGGTCLGGFCTYGCITDAQCPTGTTCGGSPPGVAPGSCTGAQTCSGCTGNGTCTSLSEFGCQIAGPPNKACFHVIKAISSYPTPPKGCTPMCTVDGCAPCNPSAPNDQVVDNFLCYNVKCPSTFSRIIPAKDQFGTHTISVPSSPMQLCAPFSPSGAFLDTSSAF